MSLGGQIEAFLKEQDPDTVRVRFPCTHGYYRSHYGEGGKLDNLRNRDAKWCQGGQWVELRKLHPSRVAILTDENRHAPTIYLREDNHE